MSYKNLEIWAMARDLTVDIHNMTLSLPKFEQFEEAQQIRRLSKSVRSNIVEDYGRRYYKGDYIRFIIYALASNDETIDHLETLFETKSLANQVVYNDLHGRLNLLGKKINSFLQAVHRAHNKPSGVEEPHAEYGIADAGHLDFDEACPESSI
jgi:four helix bundle protein